MGSGPQMKMTGLRVKWQAREGSILHNFYKTFYNNFVILTLCGPVNLLAGRSFSFAGRIPLKFEIRSEAGHFHSAGRIQPAGRTLPTPSITQWNCGITSSLFQRIRKKRTQLFVSSICSQQTCQWSFTFTYFGLI